MSWKRKGVAREWIGIILGVTAVLVLFTVFYATGVGSTKKAYTEISSLEDTRILGRMAQDLETTRILLFNRTYTLVLVDATLLNSNYLFYGNGYGYYLDVFEAIKYRMDEDIGEKRWRIEITVDDGTTTYKKEFGVLDPEDARVVYEKIIATPRGPGVMRIYAR